jgi:hypothetical protein
LLIVFVCCTQSQTDFETRVGSCRLPTPAAFTCRDIPEFASFLPVVQANAQKGFPYDEKLYEQAQEILAKCQHKPYPPQDFFKYLCGGLEAQWPLPDKFCLYGFVTALFIRSRHLMHVNDEEVRIAASMDFKYATTVLGKEGSVDFMDDSPWPVSILDLYININETEFMSYSRYSRLFPVSDPAVPLDSIHWQVPGHVMPRRTLPSQALIAVIGTHATLSVEPVYMLSRFVQDMTLRPVFYGLEPRWCEILGVCDQGTTALSQLFKDAEKDPYAFSWSVMVEKMMRSTKVMEIFVLHSCCCAPSL